MFIFGVGNMAAQREPVKVAPGTVFDWAAGEEALSKLGVRVAPCRMSTGTLVYLDAAEMLEGCTFKGFPNLHISKLRLKNCTFEDCGDIHLDECRLSDCRMERVGGIRAQDSDIVDSVFTHIRFTEMEDYFLSLDGTKVAYCTFEDIELRRDSYFAIGYETTKIDHCTFTNCTTTRADEEFFDEDDGFVDWKTCTGLPRS